MFFFECVTVLFLFIIILNISVKYINVISEILDQLNLKVKFKNIVLSAYSNIISYYYLSIIIDIIWFSYSKKNKNCFYDYSNKSWIFD